MRVEAWLFGAGLVLAWLIGRWRGQARWSLALGWLLTMGLYFKFLLDQTGNPIYPLYVNFQYVGLGVGGTGAIITQGQQLLWIPPSRSCGGRLRTGTWMVRVEATAVVPPPRMGFGYSALCFATLFEVRLEWKERRFEFPLDFVAILFGARDQGAASKMACAAEAPNWALAAAGLVAVQVLWLPIQTAYSATEPLFRYEVWLLGHSIGVVYNQPRSTAGEF